VDLDASEVKAKKLNILLKDGHVAVRKGKAKRNNSMQELKVYDDSHLSKKEKRKSVPSALTPPVGTTTGSSKDNESINASTATTHKQAERVIDAVVLPTTAVTCFLKDGAKVSFLKTPKPLKQQIEKICSTRSWVLEELILVDEDNNVIDMDITLAELNASNIYLKVNTGYARPYQFSNENRVAESSTMIEERQALSDDEEREKALDMKEKEKELREGVEI